jgi:ABC-type multidrug transport system ATPase subunit
MDQEARSGTIRLLENLKLQGKALMITSHDPVHFESLTDSSLQIRDGHIQHFRYRDNITPIHGRLRRI